MLIKSWRNVVLFEPCVFSWTIDNVIIQMKVEVFTYINIKNEKRVVQESHLYQLVKHLPLGVTGKNLNDMLEFPAPGR